MRVEVAEVREAVGRGGRERGKEGGLRCNGKKSIRVCLGKKRTLCREWMRKGGGGGSTSKRYALSPTQRYIGQDEWQ